MRGDPVEAKALLEEAGNVSRENEALALSACVEALFELEQKAPSISRFASAFSKYALKGVLDPFVLAFRLEPRLTQAIGRVPKARPHLRELLARLEMHPDANYRVVSPLGSMPLTPREHEVFAFIGQGKTNREIAQALFVAETTVKVHVGHILRKLGVRTRTEAAIQAVKRR